MIINASRLEVASKRDTEVRWEEKRTNVLEIYLGSAIPLENNFQM